MATENNTDELKQIVIDAPSVEQSQEAEKATSVVVANAKALKVTTREDLATVATDALSQVSTQRKKFEKQRVEMKAPSLEAGRRVDNFFKPFINELSEAETIIKKTMITAKQKFDKEDAAKEAKILARAEKEGRGRLTEETAINKVSEIDRVQKTNKTESGASSTFRKVKQVVITDLTLIPIEHLRPATIEEFAEFKPWPAIKKSAVALDDLIQAGHKISQIPGVKVELIDSLSAR